MARIDIDTSSGRGADRALRDRDRHTKKVWEDIRKNAAKHIADEDIISGRRDRKVRVPVRGIKDYHFRRGSPGSGVGQGRGNKGQGKPGQHPGINPGEQVFDVEVDLDDLIDIALEECGLPRLEDREKKETEAHKGYTLDSIEQYGPWPLLDKRRSLREALGRHRGIIASLRRETGRGEEDCARAWYWARGDVEVAKHLLQSGCTLDPVPAGEEGRIFWSNEDLRFRTLKEETEQASNVVVYLIRDASASMGGYKKFMARMAAFWLVEALRRIYRVVEVQFILHTTDPDPVDEHDFFQRSESGGTAVASTYRYCRNHIESAFSLDRWNVYTFHFSDGDDFNPHEAAEEVVRLLQLGLNMAGYVEIRPGKKALQSTLYRELVGAIPVEELSLTEDLPIAVGKSNAWPFLAAALGDRKDLFPFLREFLRKERTQW